MARVRLRVLLAEPDRAHLPGGTVRGQVEVEVDEDCRCKALTASLGWRTAGEANAAEGTRSPLALSSGEWAAGDRHSFPFALEVPAGPPTYEGRHFALFWTVRARAALSLAFDAEEEAPVQVGPGPAPEGTLLSKEDSGCVEAGCALVGLALLAGGGLALLLAGGFPGVGYAVAAGLGAILAFFMVPQALAYRAAGRVTVEVGPSPAARGEEIACRVVVVPGKDLGAKKVTAVLTGTERSPKGSGKTRRILTADLAAVSIDLDGPDRLQAGREAVFAGMVPVPGAGPPSFEADGFEVKWSLAVSIGFPVLPDPTWRFPITVG